LEQLISTGMIEKERADPNETISSEECGAELSPQTTSGGAFLASLCKNLDRSQGHPMDKGRTAKSFPEVETKGKIFGEGKGNFRIKWIDARPEKLRPGVFLIDARSEGGGRPLGETNGPPLNIYNDQIKKSRSRGPPTVLNSDTRGAVKKIGSK